MNPKWYPWGDSNARTRFRKPLLYPPELQGHELGGDRGIRTPDLCDANAALSQLSYIPASTVEIIAYMGSFINSPSPSPLKERGSP